MIRNRVHTNQSTRFAAIFLTLVPLSQLAAQGDSDSTVSNQTPIAVRREHRAGVTSVKFSPDGNLLATADLHGTIILWRAGVWTPIRTLDHGAEVYSLAFSPDGKILASTGGNHQVALWNTATGKRLRDVRNDHRALCISFDPAGTLLIGTEDGVIHFVDPSTGTEARTLQTGGAVWALAVSSDGSTLATALPIRVWDYRTLAKRSSPRALGQLGLALSADGKRAVSAESTGGAVLWTLADSVSNVPLRTTVERRASGARGYESFAVNMPVASVDLSRKADRVVGGGTTGIVYIWTLLKQQLPAPTRLGGHTMTVTAVALSPSGDVVASGSLDRTVRIWKLDPIH
jgi:WD40 repeat protein